MKHLILAFATTALLLLCTTTTANEYVYDTFGDPLVAGGKYYIVPYEYSDVGGGGFSWYEHRPLFTPCPQFYVNQVKENTDFGQPTTFNPTSGTKNKITVSSSINIAFPNASPPASLPIICHSSTNLWRVEDRHVLLGGQEGSSNAESVFTIKELHTGGYGIYRCAGGSSCPGLGVDSSDAHRRVILNDTAPIAVVFETEQFFLKKYGQNVA